MAIILRAAESATDLMHAFSLRKRVFVEEEARFQHSDQFVFDLYDTLRESRNFIALLEGEEAIGALRVTLPNAAGLPALDHFDFMPFIKKNGLELSKVAAISWLCTAQHFRRSPGLLMGLMKMATWYAWQNRIRYIIAPLHPNALQTLVHLGAKAVSSVTTSPRLGVSIIPIFVDLESLPAIIRESVQIPMDMQLNRTGERRIFRKDEMITRRGALETNEAYIVMGGSARTVRDDPGLPQAFSLNLLNEPVQAYDFLYGPGELFGELSLLDKGPQTLTVVGYSREVDVLVITQEDFLAELQGDSDSATKLVHLLDKRMRVALREHAADEPSHKLLALILYDASRAGAETVSLKWLAAQLGRRIKQVKPVLEAWDEWVDIIDDDAVRVKKPKALQKLAEICSERLKGGSD